jgi:hypothetical protein
MPISLAEEPVHISDTGIADEIFWDSQVNDQRCWIPKMEPGQECKSLSNGLSDRTPTTRPAERVRSKLPAQCVHGSAMRLCEEVFSLARQIDDSIYRRCSYIPANPFFRCSGMVLGPGHCVVRVSRILTQPTLMEKCRMAYRYNYHAG